MEAPASAPDLRSKRTWRSTKNQLMIGLMFLAFVAILMPLLFVMGSVISRGAAIVFRDFPAWFTSTIPIRERQAGPGMGPAIVGTILITAVAAAIAIPMGVLSAVYLNEYGKQSRSARTIRFLSTVMTGVPSIVMGLFISVTFTLAFGFSGLGGALGLACLMLPVVVRTTEEMLRLVPDHLREASYALGTRKARTITSVVLPTAAPGVVSGCLLAVARAAGETAPLLFTIGAAKQFNWNVLSGANTALSYQIFQNAFSSKLPAQERGWGAAFTLVAIAFLFTIIARVVTSRYQKRRG